MHFTSIRLIFIKAKHLFCSYCGVYSFGRTRSHPEQIDLNVRCFKRSDRSLINERTIFPIESFDGVNYEENICKFQNQIHAKLDSVQKTIPPPTQSIHKLINK